MYEFYKVIMLLCYTLTIECIGCGRLYSSSILYSIDSSILHTLNSTVWQL